MVSNLSSCSESKIVRVIYIWPIYARAEAHTNLTMLCTFALHSGNCGFVQYMQSYGLCTCMYHIRWCVCAFVCLPYMYLHFISMIRQSVLHFMVSILGTHPTCVLLLLHVHQPCHVVHVHVHTIYS